MKQIKLILSTILLLLLLTSISYGWSPPNINGPIAIDKVDGHPWGGTLASCSDSYHQKNAYTIGENNVNEIEDPASGAIYFIVSYIRIGIFGNLFITINWNKVSSEDAQNYLRTPKLD